jgi:DNA-directed RNA polymerase specialized sigma24 family protein
MPLLDHRFLNAHLVTRRGHAVVAIGAREYSLNEAAKLCGLPFGTLRTRLRSGWSIADAMTKPVGPPIPGRRPK